MPPLTLQVGPGARAHDEARQQVLAHLGQPGLLDGRPRAVYALELVLEEWLGNAFRHGGCTVVGLQVRADGGGVDLVFEDDGAPFDPRARTAWAPPPDLESAAPGGLGLMLIERHAQHWHYERVGDTNRLQVRIALDR